MIFGRKNNKQRGFTLVEVIVVAVIVAALAGVAIPMYTSYVSSSRENAAANAAGSVASFMGSCLNRDLDVVADPAAMPTTGLVPVLLTCGAGADAPTMWLPEGIVFNIVPLNASPGTVTATHSDGGAGQTYNY